MSLIPENLQYTKSHQWVRDNGDGTITVGITDYAQESLGDIVFVDLPELEMELDLDNECAVVESVKAASDLFSPVEGEVIEINNALNDNPETINHSPYDDGWMFTAKADLTDDLMSAEEYQEFIETEE